MRSYLFPGEIKGISRKKFFFFFFLSDIYVKEPGLDEVGKPSDHQL